jgi:acyl carrier protein
MNGPIFDAVRGIVERVAGRGRTPQQVDAGTRLHEGFWLDSMELLEVVIACEQHFGIVFEESTDLTPDALATVGSLANLVGVAIERQAARR